MRRVGLLLMAAVGAVCGVYTGVYLIRWEWNRAVLSGVFFVAVEVLFCTGLILERLRVLRSRLDEMETSRTVRFRALDESENWPEVHETIRAAAPPPRDRFAWLRDQTRSTNVFLPVLLGAGVIASAIAWGLEHLARATVSPYLERQLTGRLAALAPPANGLTGPVVPPRAPVRRPGRLVAIVAVLAAAAVGTAAALDFVADRTQTRPDDRIADASTIVTIDLRGTIADRDPQRILEHLWWTCTGPDVFRDRQLPTAEISHTSAGAAVVVVGAHIGEHEAARLRGCLNDNTLDKVQATVVGIATLRRSG